MHAAASLPGVTIHDEHPFLEPESERDPVRRFRGRLGGAVTLLTCGTGASRAGLTVSSLVVANGDPAHVLALVDPDSDVAAGILDTRRAVVHVLQWRHRDLADAFAGCGTGSGRALHARLVDRLRLGTGPQRRHDVGGGPRGRRAAGGRLVVAARRRGRAG